MTTDTVELTDNDKQEFFKAFLADKPYQATETLFGGKFKITLRTLTTQETKDVFDQLRQAQINDELTNDPNYILTLTTYRLALSLVDINDTVFSELTKDSYKPTDSNDSYIKARAKIFSSWPIFKLSAITEAFKRFENKVVALSDAVQKESFWEAVG